MSSGENDLERCIDGGGAANWTSGIPNGPDGAGGLALRLGAKMWSAGAEALEETVKGCG